MTRPAYHGRTHGPNGTDPIPGPASVYLTTDANTDIGNFATGAGITFKQRRFDITTAVAYQNSLGASVASSVLTIPPGLYVVNLTVTVSVAAQVATRYLWSSLSLSGESTTSLFWMPPHARPVNSGISQVLFLIPLTATLNFETGGTVEFDVWEDTAAGVLSTVQTMSASVVRLGEPADL